jgi:RNA polymerase sigma-70 factor (ECF subfamily)
LTQEFFARLLQKDYLQPVERHKGKFRTFLLVALKRFLANEWDRARAKKRGGGLVHLSIDAALAEGRYQIEPVETLTADKIYERRWALTLLDQSMARLREEFERAGKAAGFEQLKVYLTAEKGAVPYAEAAARLGVSEAAVRVAIHRFRKRFRDLFREEIAHTVEHPEEIEEEVRYLLGVLAG